MTLTPLRPFSYRFVGQKRSLLDEFSGLFDSCGFVPAADEAVIKVVMLDSGEMPEAPSDDVPVFEWEGLSVSRTGTRIVLRYRAWVLQLDLTTHTFYCSGPDPDAADCRLLRETFLLSGILVMMHRLGYFELHAAACAHQGAGYIFVGPSGSGKTAATLSLIKSGWSYISDDAILIARSPDGEVSARGLRRTFSLKADYLKKRPEFESQAIEGVPGTDKWRLDPRKIWPELYVTAITPRFIIACSVAESEHSEIVPIPCVESLARMIGSSAWLMFDQPTTADHLEVFRSLAATCRSFEMRAGRDLLDTDHKLASLIAPDVLDELWMSGKNSEI